MAQSFNELSQDDTYIPVDFRAITPAPEEFSRPKSVVPRIDGKSSNLSICFFIEDAINFHIAELVHLYADKLIESLVDIALEEETREILQKRGYTPKKFEEQVKLLNSFEDDDVPASQASTPLVCSYYEESFVQNNENGGWISSPESVSAQLVTDLQREGDYAALPGLSLPPPPPPPLPFVLASLPPRSIPIRGSSPVFFKDLSSSPLPEENEQSLLSPDSVAASVEERDSFELSFNQITFGLGV